MKFNIFDKKPEPPRVLAVREMIQNFREIAGALESDLNRDSKGQKDADLCDECCVDLTVKVLDSSAAVAQLFAKTAKVPPAVLDNALKLAMIQKLLTGKAGLTATMRSFGPDDGEGDEIAKPSFH